MALQFFTIVALTATLVNGQPSGPLLDYNVLTGAQQREDLLLQSPALLQLAAESLSRVLIRLGVAQQMAVLEEGVNANIDCFNWLINFPGGTTEWLFHRRDRNGVLQDDPLRLGIGVQGRRTIGGLFNRWLNITSTLIAEGAEIPDQGDYICEVCIARGTPFEMCHNSTLTIILVGAPPVLEKGDPGIERVPVTGGQVNIGRDLCINRSEPVQTFDILCNLLGADVNNGIRTVDPDPTRTWTTDPNDVEIFNGTTDDFSTDFLMEGNRMLFLPGVFQLANLELGTDGLITFNTMLDMNLTDPAILPELPRRDAAFVRNLIFDEMLGEYTCRVENIYGFDEAITTIIECGVPAFVPGCPISSAITAEDRAVIPVGCDICIERSSVVTIDCSTAEGDNVMYRWTDELGRFLSSNAMLTVNREGVYICTATNVDNPVGSARNTTVQFRPSTRFTGVISHPSFGVRSDSGCSRLNPPLEDEPDLCVFVGEDILLTCIDGTGEAQNATDSGGNMVGSSVSPDGSMMELIFLCDHNLPADSACASDPLMLRAVVYDPARISRTADIGNDIGPGRNTSVQEVSSGSTVTLQCPISGMNDPIGSWSFFSRDGSGGITETVLTDSDPGISVTNTSTMVSLTITNYDGDIHNGIYICRASNRAGSDSAIVALSNISDAGVWSQVISPQCNINCRDGVRVASVTCISQRDGRLLPNTMCDASIRPPSQISCEDTFPDRCFLTPIFVAGEFGPCSEDCRGGFRKRDVNCVVPMTGENRPLNDCRWSDQQEPSEFEHCFNTCCVKDDFVYCKLVGPRLCNRPYYQQRCCWTCLLRVRP